MWLLCAYLSIVSKVWNCTCQDSVCIFPSIVMNTLIFLCHMLLSSSQKQKYLWCRLLASWQVSYQAFVLYSTLQILSKFSAEKQIVFFTETCPWKTKSQKGGSCSIHIFELSLKKRYFHHNPSLFEKELLFPHERCYCFNLYLRWCVTWPSSVIWVTWVKILWEASRRQAGMFTTRGAAEEITAAGHFPKWWCLGLSLAYRQTSTQATVQQVPRNSESAGNTKGILNYKAKG